MSETGDMTVQGVGNELLGTSPTLIAAAHELKAPLALMRQLSLMLEGGGASEADQQRMLRQITLTSERALRLTTDLTRSVRLQDSLFALEPLNPQILCEEVAHELTPLFKARGRNIQVDWRTRPLLVVANRDLLRRILLGFADNALQYAESDDPVMLKASSSHAGTVRVGVRDYGPMLAANTWRTLQSKLATSPQAVQARPASSGLGLYVAGQFAEAMGGKIGALRHRNGATFYVDILASRQLSLL